MKSGWTDLFYAIGVIFLLLAVATFVLLTVSPFGVATPASWNPVLSFLAGAFGLVLIGLGIWHRRTGRRA